MNIVIVGAGTVGSAICATLAGEGHDITVVDRDEAALTELVNKFDVVGVIGGAADIVSLREAGADHADLLIAVTSGDEVNILACAAAKKLGTRHTIARVRNPEYSELMHLLEEEMNLSLTINPELAVAREVDLMLRYPSATRVDRLLRGRAEVAELIVEPGSPLDGMTLNALRNQLNIRFLVCAVERDGEVHVPSGDFRLASGDVLCFTAPDEEVARFFRALGVYRHAVRDVLIVGGDRTTYYLESLLRERKIDSTVIERDRTLCESLAEQFGASVICDDATKEDLLLSEGIDRADAFLALSGDDEDNIIVSMYAKKYSKSKVITLIRNTSYHELFRGIGIDSIVSPQSATAANILRYVRSLSSVDGSEMLELHMLLDGAVEAIEFAVSEEIEGLSGRPLRELHLREGVLIACIEHEGGVIIPSGADMISVGDLVVVVTVKGKIKGLKEILRA